MESSEVLKKFEKYVITSCVKKLEPVVPVEGKGATLRDLDGREYIDCWSGISVSNAGHGHPRIVKAIKDQAEKLLHTCIYVYPHKPAADLAEELASVSPGKLSKVFYGNSGAEAVECALKIARKFSKRHEFIALMASFHGRTLGTLSVTGQAGRRRYDMGPYLGSVAFAPSPYCYRCHLGLTYPSCNLQCAKMIEDVIDYSTSGNVAAFIAEPILGEGGIIAPPAEYFKEVKKILDSRGILFIDDEVQTGFGRTGKMFGIEHYGVAPDIVTMAKGIAAGMPLGACITNEEIGNSFEPGDHLSTFGGNPVSCAAALANLEVLKEERLPQQAQRKGEEIMKELKEMQEGIELIGDVRGKGLMIGVELVKNRKTKVPAAEEAVKVRDLARQKGVLLGHGGVKGNVLRIQPPLVISADEQQKALDILGASLKSVGG